MSEEYHAPTLNSFVAQTEHEIRPTIMVVAFEGWNDAGSAASDAARRYLNNSNPEHIGSIGKDDYYDYQFTRPKSMLTDTGRRIQWPQTEMYRISREHSPADLLIVAGVEPTFKWQSFCGRIIKLAQEQNVHAVLTLGALLADVPHTRPVPTMLNSDDARLQKHFGIVASSYEGPTGIPSILALEFEKYSIPTLSLWAQLSHYVSQAPSPRVELAFIELLEELLEWRLPIEQLREDAAAWSRGVNELAGADPEVAKYVKRLEQATDASELPEASGESIAREFERYLRRRGRSRGDGQGPEFGL